MKKKEVHSDDVFFREDNGGADGRVSCLVTRCGVSGIALDHVNTGRGFVVQHTLKIFASWDAQEQQARLNGFLVEKGSLDLAAQSGRAEKATHHVDHRVRSQWNMGMSAMDEMTGCRWDLTGLKGQAYWC